MELEGRHRWLQLIRRLPGDADARCPTLIEAAVVIVLSSGQDADAWFLFLLNRSGKLNPWIEPIGTILQDACISHPHIFSSSFTLAAPYQF
jgi:hypothetical protein